MADPVLRLDSVAPVRRSGFLRRNWFALWAGAMLIGGLGRLIFGDGRGFIGVGFGMALLLLDGTRRFVEAGAAQPKQ